MSDVIDDPLRTLTSFAGGDEIDPHLTQEWLVTNGLGGYASGTVLGAITRRYHGLLIAALPNPLGRFMMLHGLSEHFRIPGQDRAFASPRDFLGASQATTLTPAQFRLECGLPVWRFELAGCTIEKRLLLSYKQNTVYIEYRYLEGSGRVRLGLRPGMQLRGHDAAVESQITGRYVVTAVEHRLEVSGGADLPVLRLKSEPASAFTYDPRSVELDYLFEKNRGYTSKGSLWSPGYFKTDLEPGSCVVLTASTESWETVDVLPYKDALSAEFSRRRALLQKVPDVCDGIAPELILATDQFLITPVGRSEDAARARASGDEPLTVIAGYHWFTDWGRDTMISLEGLTLMTGRHQEARWILRTFAHYVKDGLIPNMFPEGEKQGLYHTADASLWFFHAISRYVAATNDRITLLAILPKLHEIANAHIAGTRFGIHMDPEDSLLVQGEEGYQLTWMDAKVDDWVVTPRRGKAVEINALWYNALSLLRKWTEEVDGPDAGALYRHHADRAFESFNRRFWNPQTGYLFDVIDDNDPSCRPNQLLAISLEHPLLHRDRWAAVVEAATKYLLTPVGLRSLAPFERDYKKRYDGDLRSRDAAYHQGSVWAWLIGPYIDALAKVFPERCTTALLQGFAAHLDQACVGSISEIFDAEEPHTPRACIAQAWSVAEVLRSWVKISGCNKKGDGELIQ